MTGLILAAGNGTRLSPEITDNYAKALQTAGETPLLSFSLRNLAALQVEKALIVVNRRQNRIAQKYGEHYRGVRLSYVNQDEQLGISNAIYSAIDRIGEDCLLQLCDEILLDPILENGLPQTHPDADFILGYTRDTKLKIRQNYSFELDGAGCLLRCTEKPETPVNDMKGTGFIWFSAECLKILKEEYDPKTNTPDTLCDFLNLLVSRGKRGKAALIAAEEINVNTPEDLNYAETRLLKEAEK